VVCPLSSDSGTKFWAEREMERGLAEVGEAIMRIVSIIKLFEFWFGSNVAGNWELRDAFYLAL
jgi:hypothetical protein